MTVQILIQEITAVLQQGLNVSTELVSLQNYLCVMMYHCKKSFVLEEYFVILVMALSIAAASWWFTAVNKPLAGGHVVLTPLLLYLFRPVGSNNQSWH